MEAATTSAARVSRGLSFPGRRRERAAGERIAVLFEEHGRMVYGVCRLLLRDPVEAEDAAQQTFLSAYRALLAGQEPRVPSAWLGTIARNECRTRLRARQAEPLTLVTEPIGEELQREVSRREEIQALCTALAGLPPQQRDAVVLREFYGLSYAEVAAALGLTGAAVESLLFRSRKRLQEQLRPMRSALGALTLPLSLRESLAQALPGFGAAGASTGVGGAVLAKLASGPVAAKVAAVTLAVGTVGTVAGIEQEHHARHQRPSAPVARHSAPAPRLEATPVRVAQTTGAPTVFASAPSTSSRPKVVEHEGSSGSGETSGGDHAGSGSSGEVEHESRQVTSGSGGGTEQESVSGSHDGSGPGSGSGDTRDSGSSGDLHDSGGSGDSGSGGSGSGGSGEPGD